MPQAVPPLLFPGWIWTHWTPAGRSPRPPWCINSWVARMTSRQISKPSPLTERPARGHPGGPVVTYWWVDICIPYELPGTRLTRSFWCSVSEQRTSTTDVFSFPPPSDSEAPFPILSPGRDTHYIHTPSIAFRHLFPKERCCKPVLGVCTTCCSISGPGLQNHHRRLGKAPRPALPSSFYLLI